MNLDELTPQITARVLSQHLNKRQGLNLPVNQLTESQARQLQLGVERQLREFRNSPDFYHAEQHPGYLNLLLLHQALSLKLQEAAGEALGTALRDVAGTLAQRTGTSYASTGARDAWRRAREANRPEETRETLRLLIQFLEANQSHLESQASGVRLAPVISALRATHRDPNSQAMRRESLNITWNRVLPEIQSILRNPQERKILSQYRDSLGNPLTLERIQQATWAWSRTESPEIDLELLDWPRLSKFLSGLPDPAKQRIADVLGLVSGESRVAEVDAWITKLKTVKPASLSRSDQEHIQTIIKMFKKTPGYKKAMTMESQRSNQKLLESTLPQAEVLLAARDIVDRVQDMVETLGKMTNEELPALAETMRDTLGVSEADSFANPAQSAIDELLAATRSTRDQLDAITRQLAGEAPAETQSEITPPMNPDLEPQEKPSVSTGKARLGRRRRRD